MTVESPTVSCVVIGLNCEKTISDCLLSIKKISGGNIIEVIYVDGGSRDKSSSVAKSISGIRIIQLDLKHSTPGKQRNAGWYAARGEWVHFFDGDVVVDGEWIFRAAKYTENNVGAIYGLRKEKLPSKNWFHFVADMEWIKPAANAKFFGGDVLIRRLALEQVGGYNEDFVAGEDPELSVRIRKHGWKIRGVNTPMCYHDINMTKPGQYIRRGIRSGYGYAEAGLKMLRFRETSWAFKATKIVLKSILILFFISAAVFFKFHIAWIIAITIIFFPFVKVEIFRRKFNVSFRKALIYAFHCSIVVWPQFFGVIKYLTKLLTIKITASKRGCK